MTRALRLYAGPAALEHLRREGLQPQHVGIVPGAAGGPKGLILGPLDRWLFGHWLPQGGHGVHLIGASIGAWRMAAACLHDAVAAFERLQRDYIAQDYELEPGQRRPSARQVSAAFARELQAFFGGRVHEVLHHPRWRVHIVTSRGRHVLAREGRWRTPLGYAAATLTNLAHRRGLSLWLERVVFSVPQGGAVAPLPFDARDLRTRQVALTPTNFMPALQASCSIPFVLQAVHDIPGAPPGAYWDGGITDYHLHLHWRPEHGLVLYPHFQRQVVPGWLDKGLRWRHRASAALAHTLLLAPDPDWVRRLPNGKLPDRTDFERYGRDLASRMRVWQTAVQQAQQLADEFIAWLQRPDPRLVEPL
ncbi:MAG: phospholipase [Tepidimonas sp.]|nr:phospholipase [Tepidimonas sp.]